VGGLAGLPSKQRVFCLEYVGNGFNATRAAKKAGYSAKTADSQGSRLLKNAKVAAAIAAFTGKACAKREITAERVLDEIAKLAFFDPRRMFRADGTLVPIQELDDATAAAIAGLDVKTLFEQSVPVGELKKIKIADKGANLERLGRYLKLFTDKVEHTGVMGVQLITSVPRPQRSKETET
jgi:phage terminase small subunit